jgi:hypothetical protein
MFVRELGAEIGGEEEAVGVGCLCWGREPGTGWFRNGSLCVDGGELVMDSVNSGTWDRITGILVVFSSGWFSAQKCMYKWNNSMTFFSECKQLD